MNEKENVSSAVANLDDGTIIINGYPVKVGEMSYFNVKEFIMDKCIEAVVVRNPKWYHYLIHSKKRRVRKKYMDKINRQRMHYYNLYMHKYLTEGEEI